MVEVPRRSAAAANVIMLDERGDLYFQYICTLSVKLFKREQGAFQEWPSRLTRLPTKTYMDTAFVRARDRVGWRAVVYGPAAPRAPAPPPRRSSRLAGSDARRSACGTTCAGDPTGCYLTPYPLESISDMFCRRRRIAPFLFQDCAWQATGWCYCSSHF
jgi:hypothetical protein